MLSSFGVSMQVVAPAPLTTAVANFDGRFLSNDSDFSFCVLLGGYAASAGSTSERLEVGAISDGVESTPAPGGVVCLEDNTSKAAGTVTASVSVPMGVGGLARVASFECYVKDGISRVVYDGSDPAATAFALIPITGLDRGIPLELRGAYNPGAQPFWLAAPGWGLDDEVFAFGYLTPYGATFLYVAESTAGWLKLLSSPEGLRQFRTYSDPSAHVFGGLHNANPDAIVIANGGPNVNVFVGFLSDSAGAFSQAGTLKRVNSRY